MRHGDAFSKLNRNPQDRLRLLKSLASNLFDHERIQTTLPRAKELSRYAEKIISLAKRGAKDSLSDAQGDPSTAVVSACRLKVFERVQRPESGVKVLTVLKDRYENRPGGYTRVWRAGRREGDSAPMAIVELVDNPNDLKKYLVNKK